MMKTCIVLCLLLQLCCCQSENTVTPMQIGSECVVENIFGKNISVANSGREEVKKVFDYLPPKGWRISSIDVATVQVNGNTEKQYFFYKDEIPQQSEQNPKKSQGMYVNVQEFATQSNLLGYLAKTYPKASVVLTAKSSPSYISVKVDATLVYVGDFDNIQNLSPANENSQKITDVHNQTHIDIISEISYLLSHKMKKNEDEVACFIEDFKLFIQNNSVAKVVFVAVDDNEMMFWKIIYNFTSNKAITLPIRKNIYNMAEFLKESRLEIHVITENTINESLLLLNWKKVRENKVVVTFPYYNTQGVEVYSVEDYE